jgi:AcrR family transcriptional regulator
MSEHSELRERIIRHARPLFFGQGFSRITTEELARQLGISKKTLYREFDSKKEIVREVVHRQLSEVDGELSTIFDDPSRSFLERFNAQMRVAGWIMNTLSKPFLYDLSRYAPDVWAEIQEFRQERVFSRMEEIIRRGQEEGMIRREIAPQLVVKIIITIADNLLVPGTIAESNMSPTEVIRHVGLLLSEGLLTETGRSRLDASAIIDNEGRNNDE